MLKRGMTFDPIDWSEGLGRTALIGRRKDANAMSDDVEVPKILRDALAGMPATIESGLLSPRTNAIDKLTWVGLALKVFSRARRRKQT